ncbi:MAG: hypothetical protein FJX46_13810 [Alphaproteobacteria bacterium]|nr:hypothetical protein [Alphaproteobacteria bacterium]
MDITPLVPADRKVIDSYGPGRFRVAGQNYQSALLVFPDAVEQWAAAGLEPGALDAVKGRGVEVLLIGCGKAIQFLPPALRAELRAAGIGVEIMDTGAACRTYNVLLAEGRKVAAALLPL